VTHRLGIVGVLIALAALLAAACGGASGASPTATAPPPPPTRPESPTSASPVASALATPEVPPSEEHPWRWGYNPRELPEEPDPQPRYRALPPGYRIETYASGLAQPTGLAFLPDGRLLVIEQGGTVRLIEDGAVQPQPYLTVNAYFPPREEVIELGLVGITVDPDFERNGYIYLYYATDRPERRTVLARVIDAGTSAAGLTEVLSLDAAPNCCHIAGSMRFAGDGTLFVSVGDHQLETDAQNIGTPFGKILRINPDGTAPDDNPFVGVDGADPRVYAYGLRNPFDFAFLPGEGGRFFATENGFFGQDAVVEIEPGANYGWPGYDISVPLAQVHGPTLFYREPVGPSGMEFYLGEALPELFGNLLFCQFHRGGALHAVTFRLDGKVDEDTIIATGCTSDVLTGPDGFVYFLDYVSGTVYRIAAG
jgi:glucose/arabinose dehydrogenase